MVAYALSQTRFAAAFVMSVCFTVGGLSFAQAQSSGPEAAEHAGILKWLPWIAFGGALHDRERAEGEFWAPLAQDSNSVLFTHLQGKLFETDAREGNFALGYRQKLSSQWVGGIWVGYDLRRSPLKHTFHQVAGGFEALSRNLDLRANWYVPINVTERTELASWHHQSFTRDSFAELANDGLEILTTETTVTTTGRRTITERALYGADAEVGVRLPLEALFGGEGEAPKWLDDHELKLFAGGYYFDSKEFEDEIVGGRVRVEWNIANILPEVQGSKLTFEADYQYDDVRKEQIEVGLRLRIPLGMHGLGNPSYNSLSYAEQRMADPIVRDTDVVMGAPEEETRTQTSVSQTVVARESAVDAVSGVRIDRVVSVDADDDANAVIEKAGSNSLIVASNEAGTFYNAGIRLLDRQTLLGAGASLELVGEKTGTETIYSPQGATPTFHHTHDTAAILVGSDTHVVGVNIEGGGKDGGHFNRGIVSADRDLTNIHIENTSIHNMGGHGIRMHSGTTNWSVRNTTISNIWDGNGIDLENLNTFEISNTSFSNIYRYSGDAIHMSAYNYGVIANNHFGTGIKEHLIRFRDSNIIIGSGNTEAGEVPRFQFFGGNNFVSDTLFESPHSIE